jgi:ribonuclease R
VKPNTALDRGAYRRATSVYLVDRVSPMLPERLSNLICSLRPDEEKLCFAVVFEMDEQAVVHKSWIGRTVIKSDHRFTYDAVQQVILTSKGKFVREINQLNKLATKLREVRFKNGSIAFETVELKFELDVQGVPMGVFEAEHNESHMLIEDFMLLANQTIAEYIGKPKQHKKGAAHRPLPFVYRVHDRPDEKKLEDFKRFAGLFGYKLRLDTPTQIQQTLNKLLKDIKGKPEENVLKQLAIRAMAKAVYATDNIGHFGLGFKHYTHFTSPIRRYPDVMVHRLLENYLEGRYNAKKEVLEAQCKHASEMERNAMAAERESVKFKQVEFMQDKVGKTYNGVVVGVTSFGMFVEMTETRCEGLVSLKSLEDDLYSFDEPNYRLYGLETGNAFTLGDRVRVKVAKTDLTRRTIDLVLLAS